MVKIGYRLFDQNAATSKSLIEGNYAVYSFKWHNAYIQFEGALPNTNPILEDLVQSGRQDFIPADTFVNEINLLDDPRAMFFDPTSKISDAYKGGHTELQLLLMIILTFRKHCMLLNSEGY